MRCPNAATASSKPIRTEPPPILLRLSECFRYIVSKLREGDASGIVVNRIVAGVPSQTRGDVGMENRKRLAGLAPLLLALGISCSQESADTPSSTLQPLSTVSSAQAHQAPTLFWVGFAQVDITPTRTVTLGGYGTYFGLPSATRRNGEGVHDPIEASVIAVANETMDTTVVFASLDLVGLSPAMTERIRDDITRQLPDRNLVTIFSATHTHHSPDTLGLWGALPFFTGRDRAYMEAMEGRTATAIVQAVVTMQPATLAYGQTYKQHNSSGRPDTDDQDSEVHVLTARASSGEVLGTFVNWASHPTILGAENNTISSDWVGAYRFYMKSNIPGTHVYMSGTLGGVSNLDTSITPRPDPFVEGDRDINVVDGYEKMAGEGYDLYTRVSSTIESASPLANAAFGAFRQPVAIPMNNFLFKTALRSGLVEGRSLRDSKVTSELTLVHLGPLRFATVPGEIFPQSASALRALLSPEANLETMIAGIGNDWLGYLIPPELYDDPEYDYFRSLSPARHAVDPILQGYSDLLQRCGVPCQNIAMSLNDLAQETVK